MALLYRMGTGNGSGGDLKPFIINFTCDSGFIGKTVTMEFQGTPHAGEVVENVSGTVGSDGKLTLYPMHDGLWKYYATSDVSGYHERTITLEKWGNYPVELVDTPNGATFTPTDDVQTWLHCANIWDKSYTTISEVVADTTTLNTLIANENANDYLVRSTTFATDICSNESAMTYIGLSDYCANKLLADSTWSEAICNAKDSSGNDLFEKVLNVKVPNMTSDTTPYGIVIHSTAQSGNDAWHAFSDGNNQMLLQDGVNSYVGYKFVNSICVKKIDYWTYKDGNSNTNFRIKFEGSNDGINYTPLISDKTITQTLDNELISMDVDNSNYYLYHKLTYLSTSQSGNRFSGCRRIQFYGREEA